MTTRDSSGKIQNTILPIYSRDSGHHGIPGTDSLLRWEVKFQHSLRILDTCPSESISRSTRNVASKNDKPKQKKPRNVTHSSALGPISPIISRRILMTQKQNLISKKSRKSSQVFSKSPTLVPLYCGGLLFASLFESTRMNQTRKIYISRLAITYKYI